VLDLDFDTYAAAGAICVEMECSALFIVGTLRRVRTGAIVAVDGDARAAASGKHQPRGDLIRQAVDREIEIALDAIADLASIQCSTPKRDSPFWKGHGPGRKPSHLATLVSDEAAGLLLACRGRGRDPAVHDTRFGTQSCLAASTKLGIIPHVSDAQGTHMKRADGLSSAPLRLFIAYAREDDELRGRLEKHLSMLTRDGLIAPWHDRKIGPGNEWEGQIDQHLDTADIILLLVSADFLASDYCYDVEATRALGRHAQGSARIVPVILRPADWMHSPLAKLQALPRDGKPVANWANEDEAFLDVVEGIRKAVAEMQKARSSMTGAGATRSRVVSSAAPAAPAEADPALQGALTLSELIRRADYPAARVAIRRSADAVCSEVWELLDRQRSTTSAVAVLQAIETGRHSADVLLGMGLAVVGEPQASELMRPMRDSLVELVEGGPRVGSGHVLAIPWTYLEWGVRLWGALALVESNGAVLPVLFSTGAEPGQGLGRFSFIETVEYWHSNATANLLFQQSDIERQLVQRVMSTYDGTPIFGRYFGSGGSLELGLLRFQLLLALLGVKERGESRVLPILLSDRSSSQLVNWLTELAGDATMLAAVSDSFGESPNEFARELIPRIKRICETINRYRGPIPGSVWTRNVLVPLMMKNLMP